MNSKSLSPEVIFEEAIQLESSETRGVYLDHACGDDARLRDEMLQLVSDHFRAGSFLESPATALAATVAYESVQEAPGTVIGPYKLLEQIGEGGMGVVFVAEQSKPVRRKVALKVIKPGMDTKEVISRFEAERQALALMDHPNIAKVFDANMTDTGRPYFVMELVQGLPITEYCDRHKLTTRERLELFILVCRAVQHAHQKAIIHRDLKPSNILVAEIDAAAVPKVIDFGVAKAIGHKLSEQTIYTQFSQLVGTPLYMSPEQAGLGVVDIDTRSDVYSLGVLLFELFTGSTPLDKETMKQAGYEEMRRIVREEEPQRPSARISTLKAEQLTTLSDQRGIDPRKYSHELSGELDWIVMRALEKDRTRRYESASAFASDIQRYLDDEPVEACPPSAMYRLSKLARRNKGFITTISLVVLALIIGTTVSLWQAVRATKAERVSEQRFDDEKRARIEAERQRTLADSRRQISDASLKMMMIGLWPHHTSFSESRFIETYNKMIEKQETLMAESATDPAVIFDLATSHATLGFCLTARGEDDKALAELEQALELSDKARSYENTPRDWPTSNIKKSIARILKKTNRIEEALQYIEFLDLTFGPGGELFVGSRDLDCVLQFDARTRRYVRVFAEGGGLSSPNGLVFGPDGHLYVCSEFGHSVLRYDGATGEFMDVFVSNVRQPVALVFGPDGNLYVLSFSTHRVIRYKGATGEFIDVFVQPESGGLNYPAGLAFGPDGNLFVASTGTHAVLHYDGESGEFIGDFISRAGLYPSDLKFDANNRLYVSSGKSGIELESKSSSLYCFDATTGENIWSAGRGIHGSATALSPDGDLYLATHSPGDVLQFNGKTGEFIGSLVIPTDAIGKVK